MHFTDLSTKILAATSVAIFFFFFSTTSHRLAFDHCQMEVQIQNYLHHRSDSSLSIKRALSLFLNFLSFVDSSCSLKKLSSILHSVCVFLRSLHIFYQIIQNYKIVVRELSKIWKRALKLTVSLLLPRKLLFPLHPAVFPSVEGS